MKRDSKPKSGRLIAVAVTLALVGAVVASALGLAATEPVAGAATQRASACSIATAPSADATVKDLRSEVLCLVNRKRTAHGLAKLSRDPKLQKAAQRHTKTILATNCLSHQCPGEVDLETRIRQAGYLDGADSWRYAENTGCQTTAQKMVEGWMTSPYRSNRTNILDPDFTDMGVGASAHRIVSDDCPATDGTPTPFNVVFASRTP
jgi:uncharacterized protein YkwD